MSIKRSIVQPRITRGVNRSSGRSDNDRTADISNVAKMRTFLMSPDSVGFHLCKVCDRQVTLNKSRKPEAHKTPLGKDCPGASYDTVHLGHDFISCAARLMFFGTNEAYTAREFWLSLLYALLGGMSDALGIEDGDINGVIRPIDLGSGLVGQEVVIFDDVPGGAGHALRLEGEGELLEVLRAAHARVANCACGESAACYTCLRSYRNQYCHDLLARGPVLGTATLSARDCFKTGLVLCC